MMGMAACNEYSKKMTMERDKCKLKIAPKNLTFRRNKEDVYNYY